MADTLNAGELASAEQAAVLNATTKQDISQAKQVQLGAASDVLLRNATRSTTGNPTNKDLTATNVYYKPDGTLVIVTQSGKEFTANKEEQEYFDSQQNERTLIVREQNNEIESFKVWAQEQGIYTLKQTEGITDIQGLERDPRYRDFRNYAAAVENSTGNLPYSTPHKDYLVTQTVQDTTLADTPKTKYPTASVSDPFANYGMTPNGSAALAGDELAALKRAVGTNSNQEQVQKSLGLAPVTTAIQAARVAAQRANDSVRYGIAVDEGKVSPPIDLYADEEERLNQQFDKLMAANQAADDANTALNNRQVPLRPNPLDEYDSYSYTISLHVLTQDEYNSMVSTDRAESFVPSNTLISGAGFGKDSPASELNESGANRAAGWEDNFFFDSLKLSSVVGLNETSKGTNVIECEFTIIEPYGLSLVDRLVVTTDALGSPGQYFSNCYLLEINFYGSEVGKLHDMKKFIPIQIIGMTIKASARGSEYRISAVPFSHHALNQTRASTPANFEVLAGTLEEFFAGEDAKSSASAATAAREIEQLRAATQNKNARQVDKDKLATLDSKVYAVGSYVAAYNQWEQTLIDLKVTCLTKPNKIAVVFDKVFLENGGSKVYRPRDQDGTVGSSAMSKGPDAKNGDNQRALATADRFSFAAGTQITEVINIAMKQSEFIRNQVVLQDQAKAGGKKEVQGKVTWWKIIPHVKMLEYDDQNNKWAFDTTYYVVPYQIWNTVHPSLPKAVPDRGICSKEFHYYYTGQNTSVIDFNIDFDFMFFTKVVATKEKNTDDGYKSELEEDPVEVDNCKKGKGVNPGVITHVADDPKTAGQRTRGDATAMAVANASDSIYSSAAGEMLNITLKIVGDPELIKQDDVFTGVTALIDKTDTAEKATTDSEVLVQGQGQQEQKDTTADNNNSLIMDNGEVVCWVEINTPVDIDEETGGVRYLDDNKVKSGFTGVYKLLMVDSEFNKGQFTQTLNMIRYMNQDIDQASDDGSYDQAMDRFSNQSNTGEVPAEEANTSSEVKINNPVSNAEEADLAQGVVVTPLANPDVQVKQLPGGLTQYDYTVR